MTLTIPAWGSASLVEILWTLIAVGGVSYTLYNFGDARRDWEAIPHDDLDNPLVILYDMLFRNERMRLGVQVAFGLAGAVSLFQYPSAGPGAQVVTFSVLFTLLCLIGAHFYMAWASWKDAGARRRLRRALSA